MKDFDKIITFCDGITLTNGENDLTDELFSKIYEIQNLGKKYNLMLEDFDIDSDCVFFKWIGKKDDVLSFYTYVSMYIYHESNDKRRKTQIILLRK